MGKFEILKEALEQISNASDTFNMTGKSDYDCFEECIFIASKALSMLEEEKHCLVDYCLYNVEYKCSLNHQLSFSKQVETRKECPFKVR